MVESTKCPACQEQGAIGRLGIFEVVPVSRRFREAMTETTDYDTLHDIAKSEGMISMRQDGIIKALAGEVQFGDVIRVTSEDQTPTKGSNSNK